MTIHTPEFYHEYDSSALKKKIKEYNLTLPVYIDNNHKYWNALACEGWPSVYLVDRKGLVRYVFLGETHNYFAQARAIEEKLRMLIAESTGD